MKKAKMQKEKKIGEIIYKWLLILVLVTFVLAAVVGFFVQDYFQKRQSFTILRQYIEDVDMELDLNGEMEEYICGDWGMNNDSIELNFDAYQDNDFLKRLVNYNSEWLTEVTIVNNKGVVTHSSNPDMIGYDLHDNEYMSEFLCILDGKDYYARDFYPNPFETDNTLKMVYGAVSVKDFDGLVLFGFDRDTIKAHFEGELWDAVTDKRIGETGYMIACNPEGKMVGITEAAISDRLQEETPYTGEVELPETEDEISKQITEFYGEKCYVSAVKRKGYYLIAAYPVKDANALRKKYNIMTLIIFAVVFTALLISLYVLLKNHVVHEVISIHGSLKRITEGDLNEKASADGSLEFCDLSDGINETVSNLKDRIQAAKEQIAEEMEKAKRIQKDAVPGIFPEHDNFGLYASMYTAEAVGGDFYDFFMVDVNTLCFVVADVPGKGLPAALYMMNAKTLIRTFVEQGLPIDQVAEQVNRKLCENSDGDMFLRAWLGLLDLRTGLVSYVHAGHTLPILVGNNTCFVKQEYNSVFGVLKTARYLKQEIRLLPGESIYLYTDGVIDAQNAGGELYRADRLLALIKRKKNELLNNDIDSLCRSGCEMVYEHVKEFMGGFPQLDDITMIWLTYKGAKA
ncbi:MAG: SpoIIE family protein phosphatase [Eubacterium sp.]|nr:SpoIIE family protein phosphatase [Eubacterium sp.]